MRTQRRWWATLGVLVATGALVTACGSSGGSASGTGSSSPQTAGSAATGSEIVLGNVGSYGGPQASSEGGVPKVIDAWQQWVNAHGGVAGHKVRVIVKDDADDPAKAVAAVKELIEADHVVAIVGANSNVDGSWAAYAASKGVPVLGGASFDTPYFTNADFFPTGANLVAMIYGALALAKSVGPTTGVLYCAEAPQCAQAVPLDKALAQAVGVQLPVLLPVSATAPDYTALCQKLKEAGVQSYEVGSAAAVAVRVAEACKSQGVDAVQINVDGTLSQAWLTSPAFEGTLVSEVQAPFFLDTTPAHKEYRDAIAKYAPDLGALDNPNAFYAWVGGKLLEAAVAKAPAGPVTSASIKQGLYALHGETLGGLAPPLTYTEGKPTIINCTYTIGISGGKLTAPDGDKTQCAPDAVVNAVVAKLAG
ncbi:MAG TPA: ABC transporter substrate-binding protein [Mycobacteriales bacterium]|jgi:branched-chain amino acid transport system substrate-binding protein|nr:ABC transporter substrate-binding protein [Mycobacteriales bacterium]